MKRKNMTVSVKTTRRALGMNILSLLLCVSMLIGTTFAWFTDSVTSGRNQIIAGNLDVELVHSHGDMQTPETVADATDLFSVAKVGDAWQDVHWEPGMVVYENFTVQNVGDMAFKYTMTLNVYDKNTVDGHDLSEVIKVAVVDDGFSGDRAAAQELTYTTLADFQKSGDLNATETAGDTYGVVLYWEPTDHDNDYNVNNTKTVSKAAPKGTENRLFIEFGINLVATQDTVESDSFDNQYDAFASYSVDFEKMTEHLAIDGTEDLEIKKTGIIEEAKVPAAAANAVFDAMAEKAPEGFKDEGTTKELVLTLNVERQETTGTTQKYEIDMDAVMTFVNGGNSTSVTEDVKTLSNFVTIQVKVPAGLEDVNVTHNGSGMEKLASPTATPTADITGGYYYDKATGSLYLVTKTFSPFELIWTNLLTVTPTSTPVYAQAFVSNAEGWENTKDYFKYENDRYVSAPAQGALHTSYPQAEGSYVQIVGAAKGDTVYLYFDKDITPGTDAVINIRQAQQTVTAIDAKTYKFNIDTVDETGRFLLDVTYYSGSFTYTIKIHHKDPPKITTQPTAETKTVVATGDNISYQWYKMSEDVAVTATNSNGVYAAPFGESETEQGAIYENGMWKAKAYWGDAAIIVYNLKAGDIVKFTKAGNNNTATIYTDLDSDPGTEISESGFAITTDGTWYVSLSGNIGVSTVHDLGTLSIAGSNEKLVNETGATLSATAAGTYQCVITDSHGNQAISDAITLQ